MDSDSSPARYRARLGHPGRAARRLWSWSKFAFAPGFGALECIIVIAPLLYINLRSRYFIPVYVTACIVAALNFIWMIIVARRWKLPDGRTRLQAYRDYQREFQGGK